MKVGDGALGILDIRQDADAAVVEGASLLVKFKRRVVRLKRRAPSRSSSRLTCLLTAEGVSPNVRPAPVKLPASTVRAKTAISAVLSMDFPYL